MPPHVPHILLVEDNPADIALTREAFDECGIAVRFSTAPDGVEAVRFLRKEGEYTDLPDVIMLDLNMPRMGGREVLFEIKHDDRLRHIPTLILSTSARRQDIDQCYALCANTYIVKPAQWSRFLEIVRSLEHYWFSVASLPQD